MTHYTTRYDSSDPVLADAKAIQDLFEYIGQDRAEKLWAFVQQANGSRKQIVRIVEVSMMFLGVSGRPVRAYARALLKLRKEGKI